MIIKTPQRGLYLAIDIILTSLAWAAFLYLFVGGIIAIFMGDMPGLAVPWVSVLLPAMHTLLSYLLVSIGIAAILTVWAQYNARHFGWRQRRRPSAEAPMEKLAGSFGITLGELLAIQESRRMIIHHTEDGRITLLEGDAMAKPYRPATIPWPQASGMDAGTPVKGRPAVLH